ncbi:microcompartment protein PduM [Entomohabitans teleogrylli]|uniref:microcompartment protein PduM n=1 Tax=Entomohabitans teleogrylli TaxID=1384589 RepID=UPI00073D51A3|nr:microcompartment protein PduM [Entomohabitans teleogrylli]
MTAADIGAIVNRVLALLQARERQVYAVTAEQLRRGLDAAIPVHHATLHVRMADIALLDSLAERDADDPAVAALLDALSWGMRVHISLHARQLGALSVKKLARLPLSLADHQGFRVWLHPGSVVSFRDVAGKDGWLVVPRKTVITPLASEAMQRRSLHLLRQE